MKRIGFLTFGHYQPGRGSVVPTARDALLQTIELAVAAEELGFDGAYLRVHHFAQQQTSPFPILAAIAARTRRIEIGTGVIDMRYENPLYMAEEAAPDRPPLRRPAPARRQSRFTRACPQTARNCSDMPWPTARRQLIWPTATLNSSARPLPVTVSLSLTRG